MNWKTTIFLAILAVLVVAGVIFLQPREGAADRRRVDILAGWTQDHVETITIAAPGQVEITLRRGTPSGGSEWQLASHQTRWPAEDFAVREMLRSLFAGRQSAAIKPGDKEYDLDLFGLREPRLVVTLAGGGRRISIRFGREGTIQKGEVWIQVDGDPNVYYAATETLAAFQKDIRKLRNRQFVWFETHRVKKVTLVERFRGAAEKRDERGNVIRPQEFVFETSAMELRKTGWFLEKPEERVEDAQVQALLSGLRNVVAHEFEPKGNLRELGLEEPRVRIRLEGEGGLRLEVRFGADAKEKGHLCAWIEGSDEVAIVNQAKYFDPLPTTRSAFRSRRIVYWTEAQTKRIEVEVRGLGKIALLQKKDPVTTGTMTAERITWVPEGLDERSYIKDAATSFGQMLFMLQLESPESFLGAPTKDLKELGLDPPAVEVRFFLENQERALQFGIRGKDAAAGDFLMKKSWHDEIYWAPEPYVRLVRRLELNYRRLELWQVDRERIAEFWFEDNTRGLNWRVARSGEQWRFIDDTSLRLKREIDDTLAQKLHNSANYVIAKQFIGKDEETLRRFMLYDSPAYRFFIVTGKNDADRKVIWITENYDQSGRAGVHYARFEGDPVVFRIDEALVGLLLGGLHKRPRPDPDPNEGHERHK